LIQQAAKNGQALRAKWNTLNPQSQHNFLVQVKKRWEEIFLKSALPQHFTQAFRSLEKQVKPQDSKPTSMGMSIVSFIAPDLDVCVFPFNHSTTPKLKAFLIRYHC